MSPDLWKERVEHMIADIRRIETFIAPHDLDSFLRDEQVIFAVSYAFVRLGEASGHIPPAVQAAHPDIPWRNIRHFRNFMIHVYDSVIPERLFETARDSLPGLADKLQGLL